MSAKLSSARFIALFALTVGCSDQEASTSEDCSAETLRIEMDPAVGQETGQWKTDEICRTYCKENYSSCWRLDEYTVECEKSCK